MPKTFSGASRDQDKHSPKAKESVTEGGPSYDKRPAPGKGKDMGPNAPSPYNKK